MADYFRSSLTGLLLLNVLFVAAQSVNTVPAAASHEALYGSMDSVPPRQVLPVLEARFANAKASGDGKEQLALSRYLARTHYLLGQSREVGEWHEVVDSLARVLGDTAFDRGYEMHRIAYVQAMGQPQQSLALLNGIRARVQASGDTLWQIRWQAGTAKAYITMDDWAKSMQHLVAAEQLNSSIKNPTMRALLTTLRGDLYWEQRKPPEAMQQYQSAAALYEAQNDWQMLLPIYTNLVSIAVDLKQEQRALDYTDRLTGLQQQFGSTIGYYTAQENSIYNLIQLENFEAAVRQARRTIRLADSLQRDPAHATYLLGISYRGLNRYDLAAPEIERAFEMGLQKRHFGQCTFYAHALYQTYYWKDQYEPALQWHQAYVQYRDSVYSERKAKEFAVLEARYESLQQQRKVEQLEAQAALDAEKRRQLWLGLLLLAAMAAVTVYAQRQRAKRQSLAQQARYQKLEQEQQQLQQELAYKQRELAAHLLHMQKKNAVLHELKEGLKPFKQHRLPRLPSLLRLIDQNIGSNEEWDTFLHTFHSLHTSFMDKLQALSSELTANEIRLASLLRMNLSSKEIASLLNITNEGVKKARYRLRKKLALDSGTNIQEFLLGL
jgi:DNA-binding CsgD family transcriptional regulator